MVFLLLTALVVQQHNRFTVIGYGQTQVNAYPPKLQTMTTNLVDWSDCQYLIRSVCGSKYKWIDTSNMCIRGGIMGEEYSSTPCIGDSGSPYMYGKYIYGVHSWTIKSDNNDPGCQGCYCCTGLPQVGTNVALLTPWIQSVLKEWGVNQYMDNQTDTAL